jgi:hypothetical protein
MHIKLVYLKMQLDVGKSLCKRWKYLQTIMRCDLLIRFRNLVYLPEKL